MRRSFTPGGGSGLPEAELLRSSLSRRTRRAPLASARLLETAHVGSVKPNAQLSHLRCAPVQPFHLWACPRPVASRSCRTGGRVPSAGRAWPASEADAGVRRRSTRRVAGPVGSGPPTEGLTGVLGWRQGPAQNSQVKLSGMVRARREWNPAQRWNPVIAGSPRSAAEHNES